MSTSSLSAAYERDGFLIVPGLISPAECDQLKVEARKVLDAKSNSGSTVCLFAALNNPAFRALAEDPRIVDVLRAIMPDGVMFLNDKIVFKKSDKAFATPYHIDYFYWQGTRAKLSVWIPLDDVSAENGALTVIPGSHKKEWKSVKGGVAGDFFNVVDGKGWQDSEVVVCSVVRGSAVIFSDRLVHGSTVNTAKKDRYVVISTYQAPGADEPFDLDFPVRKVLVAAS